MGPHTGGKEKMVPGKTWKEKGPAALHTGELAGGIVRTQRYWRTKTGYMPEPRVR